MSASVLDVVVVGAGQAGLAISQCLKHDGLRHIVLERGKIGESWRTQRWDSFALNSPNKFNVLPGDTYRGIDPDGFDSAKGFVSYLEDYADRYQLPVEEHSRVISVEPRTSGYQVTTAKNGTTVTYTCRKLVVASGAMNVLKIPSAAQNISPKVRQYHAGEYRAPSQLPDGGVLVVGSAQSGLQVAEELIGAGRRVYLSTSAVGRVPRRYRGKDILEWLLEAGFYDVKTEEVADPKEFEFRQPQVSGVGPRGHTLSLQSLANRGAVVLGKLDSAKGSLIDIQTNAADHVRFSDEVSCRIKALVDQFIARKHLDAPPPESDPADEPDTNATCASPRKSLDLQKEDIRSVIWSTGFASDYSYLKGLAIDSNGRPIHRNGISNAAGLYFLGMPWLRKRKSGIVTGTAEDAVSIAGSVRSN